MKRNRILSVLLGLSLAAAGFCPVPAETPAYADSTESFPSPYSSETPAASDSAEDPRDQSSEEALTRAAVSEPSESVSPSPDPEISEPASPSPDPEISEPASPSPFPETSTSATPVPGQETSASMTPAPEDETSASTTPAPEDETSASATPAPTQETSASATPVPAQETPASTTPVPPQEASASATPVPSQEASASTTPVPVPEVSAVPDPANAPDSTPAPDATLPPAPQTTPVPTQTPVPSQAAAVPSPTPTGSPDASETLTAVLKDGTYTLDDFTFTGGTGKLRISCTTVTAEGGKVTGELSFSSNSLYAVKWTGGEYQSSTPIKSCPVPLTLNEENTVILTTYAMSAPHDVEYKVYPQLTITEDMLDYIPSPEHPEDPDVPEPAVTNVPVVTPGTSPVPTVSVKPGTPTVTPTGRPTAPTDTPAPVPLQPTVTPVQEGTLTPTPSAAPGYIVRERVIDGTYEASTDLTIGKMFNIIRCQVTIQNQEATAVLTLNGTGYDYLYMGSAEEAVSRDASSWIPAILDENGRCTYTIPVPALDQEICFSARSKRYAEEGAAQPWYDRAIIIHSDGMPKETITVPTDAVPSPAPGQNDDSITPSVTPAPTVTAAPSEETEGYGADTSGSTSSVDSSTALADGTYSPDSFSFSGGTGRLSISCSQIRISGGRAYAVLLFDSGKIGYVKADGQTFYPSGQSGSSSTFEIPVRLNANNSIIAMTTAMSQPHEVGYSIYVGLEAARKADAEKAGKTDSQSLSAKAGDGASIEKKADAPSVSGLTYEGSRVNKEAKLFRLHYFQNNICLLEISLERADRKEASANAGEKALKTEAPGEKSLYDAPSLSYLIVPEGTQLPAGMEKEFLIIQRPVKKAMVSSGEALKFVEELSCLDKVCMIGLQEEEIASEEVLKKLQAKEILPGGSYERPDFRELVKSKADLAVVPSDILKTPEDAASENASSEGPAAEGNASESAADIETPVRHLGDQFALLHIPMIVDRAKDETTRKGKEEWRIVYETIFKPE